MANTVVLGTIWLEDIECNHCGHKISVRVKEDHAQCPVCGALYEKQHLSLNQDSVSATYEFLGFACMYSSGFDKCKNICPSPYMYCADHSNEETISKQEDSIQHYKKRLEKEEDRLKMMKESRKTWIVMKLSGIDEQDSSLSED